MFCSTSIFFFRVIKNLFVSITKQNAKENWLDHICRARLSTGECHKPREPLVVTTDNQCHDRNMEREKIPERLLIVRGIKSNLIKLNDFLNFHMWYEAFYFYTIWEGKANQKFHLYNRIFAFLLWQSQLILSWKKPLAEWALTLTIWVVTMPLFISRLLVVVEKKIDVILGPCWKERKTEISFNSSFRPSQKCKHTNIKNIH